MRVVTVVISFAFVGVLNASVIIDTLGRATPETTFQLPGSSGISLAPTSYFGPEFALSQTTLITEIGGFVNVVGYVEPGVPTAPANPPAIVYISPAVNGAPSMSLFGFFLTYDGSVNKISYEYANPQLILGPGTYFALFAPQGQDTGFVLSGAQEPFLYLSGSGITAILNPQTGTSLVGSEYFAARILGISVPEPNGVLLAMEGLLAVALTRLKILIGRGRRYSTPGARRRHARDTISEAVRA